MNNYKTILILIIIIIILYYFHFTEKFDNTVLSPSQVKPVILNLTDYPGYSLFFDLSLKNLICGKYSPPMTFYPFSSEDTIPTNINSTTIIPLQFYDINKLNILFAVMLQIIMLTLIIVL